jgi:hypothetical protein
MMKKVTGMLPALGLVLAATACAGDDTAADGAAISRGFPTLSVVFGDDAETSYVSVLQTLNEQSISYDRAREFAGWSDLWVHQGKLFIADGESPVLTRYALGENGKLASEGKLSFQDYGVEQVSFWAQLFASETKAYFFNTSGREVVVWNPSTLEIEKTFALPELPDRAGQVLVGPAADRSAYVRGNRAYVPFYWADWQNFALSDDSVILVIDTEKDRVVDAISVDCPELNFATIDDERTIYFSNWGYSALPTLLDGKPQACSVRIKDDGTDQLDPDFRLTFADLTEGREASALRWLGDGKALLTVLHDERLEVTPDADRFALTDSANWRLWMVDLNAQSAEPLDALGWHAPGLYGTRLQDETYLSVPSADYATTQTYRFHKDGTAEPLWEATGWQTRLFELR